MDEIVYFNQLTEENFRGIAGILLGELRSVMQEKGIELVWDDAVLEYLTKKGYSAAYGARNLRRLIQKEIEDAIASEIIDTRRGAVRRITVSAQNDQLTILSE